MNVSGENFVRCYCESLLACGIFEVTGQNFVRVYYVSCEKANDWRELKQRIFLALGSIC